MTAFVTSDPFLSSVGHLSTIPQIAESYNSHPGNPNQASDDSICDFALFGVGTELEAQSAVDDGKGNHYPPEPDMSSRPHGSTML